MHYEHFTVEIPANNVETWYIRNIVTSPGQYVSAQKFATLAGGYYPFCYCVIASGHHWILIRCAAHHPYELKNLEPSAKYAPGAMRYVCVGADSIRPVVSPQGKQRRRKAPTMHHRTFYDEIRRYHESNMVYWQHCCIGWCVTVLLKNLQRWRADDIRPYTVCATE